MQLKPTDSQKSLRTSDSQKSYDISDPDGHAGKPLLGMNTWSFTVREVTDEWDSNHYDIKPLPTWAAFTFWRGSAWVNPALWNAVMLMALISATVAVVASFFPYHTNIVRMDMLLKLGTLFTVVIGFLLGMFISSAMQRWYESTGAFMTLLDSVRNMQTQLTALGVESELKDTVIRYGLLSAWLLNLNLQTHCVNKPGQEEPDMTDEMMQTPRNIREIWRQLDKMRPNIVSPKERRMLMRYNESYSLLWTWVASLVGRMASDGDIPPMATPTYGRILDIIKTAYASIRKTQAPFLIKAPFIYMHTLSLLVQVNNFINAAIFGIVLGKMIPYLIFNAGQLREHRLSEVRAPDTFAYVFVAFCLNLVVPALYLTLLDASTSTSQPFKFMDAKVPLLRCIKDCEDDLRSAHLMAEEPPFWDKPVFKARK